jgi:hypothetical protein
VNQVTVRRLTLELRDRGHSVTEHAVYSWIQGRTSPRFPIAQDLVTMSEKRLSLADVYRHREVVKR